MARLTWPLHNKPQDHEGGDPINVVIGGVEDPQPDAIIQLRRHVARAVMLPSIPSPDWLSVILNSPRENTPPGSCFCTVVGFGQLGLSRIGAQGYAQALSG